MAVLPEQGKNLYMQSNCPVSLCRVAKQEATGLYTYDRQFYKYICRGALDSASEVVPLVQKLVPQIGSVLDVGCGSGAWLSVWKAAGVKVMGLDGDYVDRAGLLVDAGEFRPVDISSGFATGEKYDLAQCLEVAEHLSAVHGRILVESLCAHADVILFSAAAPGQGGEHHINEQPYQYWRDLFANEGFQMYDVMRRPLLNDKRIMPWYRYNTFLYVRLTARPDLHADLVDRAVPADQCPADISPWLYRLRKLLVGLLPAALMTRLAVLKKYLVPLLPGAR